MATVQRHQNEANEPDASLGSHLIQSKLKIGQPGDKYEQEADRVADAVMQMPDPAVRPQPADEEEETLQMQPMKEEEEEHLQMKCQECEEQEKLQMKQVPQGGEGGSNFVSPEIARQINASKGQGSPLAPDIQREMSSKIGANFDNVQIHKDSRAVHMNRELGSEAFTHSKDIYFNRGKYDPASSEGRHLLAHELTHVVQQNRSSSFVQRKKSKDPLCTSYVWNDHRTKIEELIKKFKKGSSVENRLALIRELKWTHRCSSDDEKSTIRGKLKLELGSYQATALWSEAGTPFGGYRGSYPGYYGGAKGRLKQLGTSEVDAYEAFKFDPRTDDASAFRAGRTAAAVSEKPTLKATDILYFYGHQYAQYKNPGVFANGTQTQFIDLRALKAHGAFNQVKLIISTSCATICKEAIDVFASLFPNAVILGYRKSAPLHGSSVRSDFERGIRGLKRPLLLEKDIDVTAIINVWKSVVKKHHPNEARRYPGYYKGGTVYYLEKGKWKSMSGTDSANSCKKKGSQIREAAD